MAPFRHLLKPSTPFDWSEDLEEAFVASKMEIVRLVEEGVHSFDPTLTTCLSPDFSKTGMGWVLQQKTCTCSVVSPLCCPTGWRLVLAGGRFTIPAETRYSPTEGEALAVAEGLESSKYYTLGCKDLYVATDHMPLLGILCDRALDTIPNPRLVRIKERTLWWNFKIIHVPGKRQAAADAISRRRLPVALHTLTMADPDMYNMEQDMGTTVKARLCEIKVDCGVIASVSNSQALTVITWDRLVKATQEDHVMVKLMEQILRGFPDSQHDMHSDTKEFHRFRHGLHVVEGVICYKNRLIIPVILRGEVLDAIHSAHQGVTGMNNRVEQAVFWPGLTTEILTTRHACMTCIKDAPSQPAGVPVPPPSPEYPFQMVVGDYFSLQGQNYLVMADRFSGWLSIYEAGKGEFDGATLEKQLRRYFLTFNIPEEFSSDGGPQMMSEVVQNFLQRWGLKHRLSSAYNPHSNSRAELAVKSGKRILRDNMNNRGGLNTDKYARALMQYRNTPHQDTRLSPAQIVFNRQLRDFIPVLSYKYRPSQEWCLLQEDRERAMASRREADGSRLAQYTKEHHLLQVG
jgi:hypothetical protein